MLASVCSGESPLKEAGGAEWPLIHKHGFHSYKSTFAHTVQNQYHWGVFCSYSDATQATGRETFSSSLSIGCRYWVRKVTKIRFMRDVTAIALHISMWHMAGEEGNRVDIQILN